MAIEDDFGAQVAGQIRAELAYFSGKCHYDEIEKKIVYHCAEDALAAYAAVQKREIGLHKWIDSDKCSRDLGGEALDESLNRYLQKFAQYWRYTHAYIPADKTVGQLVA
jgi:hypothetical protein